jgi:hypothetical protein
MNLNLRMGSAPTLGRTGWRLANRNRSLQLFVFGEGAEHCGRGARAPRSRRDSWLRFASKLWRPLHELNDEML